MNRLSAIPDESRDYHKKSQTNLRLTDEGREALSALADFYGIPASNVVEILLRERVQERGLKLDPSSAKKRNARSKRK